MAMLSEAAQQRLQQRNERRDRLKERYQEMEHKRQVRYFYPHAGRPVINYPSSFPLFTHHHPFMIDLLSFFHRQELQRQREAEQAAKAEAEKRAKIEETKRQRQLEAEVRHWLPQSRA
jgi:hypothetical protein